MLSCLNLTCERGEKRLFSSLGVTFLPGSLTWVKGPNGIGKSSFLKLLCGILEPVSGSIEWENTSISHQFQFLNHCQYISDRNALKPTLSAKENLNFWATMRGTGILVPAALHFFGFGDKENIPVGKLSAGWQRRAALARLAAMPCPLWLLDEPATHLDDDGANRLATLIAGRVQQGGIVIYTGHQPISTLNPTTIIHLEDWR